MRQRGETTSYETARATPKTPRRRSLQTLEQERATRTGKVVDRLASIGRAAAARFKETE